VSLDAGVRLPSCWASISCCLASLVCESLERGNAKDRLMMLRLPRPQLIWLNRAAATQGEAGQVWRLLLAAEEGRALSDRDAKWLLELLTRDYGQLEYQRRDFFKSYIYKTFQLAPASKNQELEDEIAQVVVTQIRTLLMDKRHFSAVGMPLRVLGARNRAVELSELAGLETHPDAQVVAEYKSARASLK